MVPAIAQPSIPSPRTAGRALQRALISLAAGMALHLVTPSVMAATAPEDALDGPDVVIIAEQERTIYEFRQNGQLRMVRIEPKHGPAYYLVPRDPTRGYGDLERADMLLPSWVILEF